MKLLFVGGAHGVGKSTLCRAAAESACIVHRTASGLIREASPEAIPAEGKYIQDLDSNQRLLIGSVDRLRGVTDALLLDGHYVIGVKGRGIQAVPAAVFLALAPDALAHISAPPDIVLGYLVKRDGRERWSDAAVREFLERDFEHAREVAAALQLPLKEFSGGDRRGFISWIKPYSAAVNEVEEKKGLDSP